MNKFTISYKLALAICVSTLLVVTPFVADASLNKPATESKKTEVVLVYCNQNDLTIYYG